MKGIRSKYTFKPSRSHHHCLWAFGVFGTFIHYGCFCSHNFVACAAEEEGGVGEPTLTPGLLSAFKAAESMRRELVSPVFQTVRTQVMFWIPLCPVSQVEAKQKLMEEKEKEENEEKKAQVDEDTPGNYCNQNYLIH